MLQSLDPRRVFQPTGNPSATYVERDKGKYEGQLSDGLTTGGLACLIAGPSKTGKSTLYSRVCAAMGLNAIVVRCDDTASPDSMWHRALTALGASYLAKQTMTDAASDKESGQTKISLKVPFITAEGGSGGEHTDSSTRSQEVQYFQGPPSPSTLVQFWRHGKEVIVIEDTHFLREDVRRTVYQQCKTLSDNNIPLILVSTAQVATDITFLVKDLTGRCSLTRLPEWNSEDLAMIVNKGFAYMRADVTQPAVELIANESVGLPFLTQMICHRMVKARFMEDKTESGIAAKPFSTEDAVLAMNEYAMDEQHRLSYDRYLRLGGKDREILARVLSAFVYNPLKFSLSQEELIARIHDMSSEAASGERREITQALHRLRNDNLFGLLEWHEDLLYMTEPIFLFYLRWRHPHRPITRIQSMAREIYDDLTKAQ